MVNRFTLGPTLGAKLHNKVLTFLFTYINQGLHTKQQTT